MRVHELSKELNLSSDDLLKLMEKEGISAQNHMSGIDTDTVEMLRKRVSTKKKSSAASKKKSAPKTKPAQTKKTKTTKTVKPKAEKVVKLKAKTKKTVKPKGKIEKTAEPKAKAKAKAAKAVKAKPKTEKTAKPKAKIAKKDAQKTKTVKAAKPKTKTGKKVELVEKPAGDKKPRAKPKIVSRSKAKVKKTGKPRVIEPVTITEAVTVRELSQLFQIPAAALIQKLMGLGHFLNMNQLVEENLCCELAELIGVPVITPGEPIMGTDSIDLKTEGMEPRAPVVTMLGHVDHGKTSLLDYIRKSRIVSKEAGGITQHIGAYRVTLPDKNTIVFLDTPGHEAFTAMRARGAQVTDIVVLVIAADDGVMPQTIEAINHAKAAEVPIALAINKIDKADANTDKLYKDLMKYQLIPEKWGGDTICVEVSAKEGTNIEELLEMIQLQAEMLELKANPNQQAVGIILESKVDKTRGPVATVLIQKGTLHVGEAFICGFYSGKVRALIDDNGKMIKEAKPSTPVSILGISGTPNPGELFQVVSADKKARQLAEQRKLDHKERKLPASSKVTLQDLYDQIEKQKIKDFNIVLKTDVQGSIEALSGSLTQMEVEGVALNIIHSGVGLINSSDVLLASASNAIILGFGTRADSNVSKLAETESVEIKTYDVIYDIIDDIQKALAGMIEPEIVEEYQGKAEVLAKFKVPKAGIIAGCRVKDGNISRNSIARVIRSDNEIFKGNITSLKRFKDDVKEVATGFDCGIGLTGFNEFEPGDVIETYIIKVIQDTPSG